MNNKLLIFVRMYMFRIILDSRTWSSMLRNCWITMSLVLVTSLCMSMSFASAPDTLWTKTFGGVNNDWGTCVDATSDGGYIIAGYTFSYGTGLHESDDFNSYPASKHDNPPYEPLDGHGNWSASEWNVMRDEFPYDSNYAMVRQHPPSSGNHATYHFASPETIVTLTVGFKYTEQRNSELTVYISPDNINWAEVTDEFGLHNASSAFAVSADLTPYLDNYGTDAYIRFKTREWSGNYWMTSIDDFWATAIASDGYLAKTDQNGELVWEKTYGADHYALATEWGVWGTESGNFRHANGICVDNQGYVYIADGGYNSTSNHRIQKFRANGTYVTEWGGQGDSAGQFENRVLGIATDSQYLYVVDHDNYRIQKFTLNGECVLEWGSYGSDTSQFISAHGIAIDQTGNVYVVDDVNQRVQKFTSNGAYIAQWNCGNSPRVPTCDDNGYIYITDHFDHVIRKYDTSGQYIDSWGGYGTGPGQFSYPVGIACDDAGHVFVCDSHNGRIQIFTNDGIYVSEITGLVGPAYLTVNPDYYLYVTDGSEKKIHRYGNAASYYAHCVQSTNDNGYVVTGSRHDMVNGYGDVWLLKTDANGDLEWSTSFGGSNSDFGYSVKETNDGGYVVAGITKSFGVGLYDVWLLRMNENGDTLWTSTVGGIENDYAHAIEKTDDGGYAVAGWTYTFGGGVHDVWLIKTDSLADTLWTETYGNSGWNRGYDLRQTTDGGFVIAGSRYLDDPSADNQYIVRTNTIGDTIWTKTYSHWAPEIGRGVCETLDRGYVVAGWTYRSLAGNDILLVRTGPNGDTVWTKCIGGERSDAAYSVLQNANGEYVVFGYTNSHGLGEHDMYLVKLAPGSGDFFSWYNHEFEEDPVWTTNDPSWFYWNEDSQTYHLTIISDGSSKYTYEDITWYDESFVYRFDIKITDDGYGSGIWFGIYSDDMINYQNNNIVAHLGRDDGGHNIFLQTCANGVARSTGGNLDWPLDSWFRIMIIYDQPSNSALMLVTNRATGDIIQTLSVELGDALSSLTKFGASNINISVYDGMFQAEIDNVGYANWDSWHLSAVGPPLMVSDKRNPKIARQTLSEQTSNQSHLHK